MAVRKGGVLSVARRLRLIDKFPIGRPHEQGHHRAHRPAARAALHARDCCEHVQEGKLDPSFLVTHRMSLEDAPRGYEMFKKKEDGCVRAVFQP